MISRKTVALVAAVAMTASFALPTPAAAMTHHRGRAHAHAPMMHGAKPTRMAPRDGGSAAVDALNQQSLDRARGGAAAPQ